MSSSTAESVDVKLGDAYAKALFYYISDSCSVASVASIGSELAISTLKSFKEAGRNKPSADAIIGSFLYFFNAYRTIPKENRQDFSDIFARFVVLSVLIEQLLKGGAPKIFNTKDMKAFIKELAGAAMNCGDLIHELSQALKDHPPPKKGNESPSKAANKLRTQVHTSKVNTADQAKLETVTAALNKAFEQFSGRLTVRDTSGDKLKKAIEYVKAMKPAQEVSSVDSGPCLHLYFEKWSDGFHCCDCKAVFTNDTRIQIEQAIIDGIKDTSVPEDGVKRGVPIRFLVEFANACNCRHMTTREVRRKIIMPATRDRRCRFVELSEIAPIVDHAATFVSHCWDGRFGDLVDALCDGDADLDRVVWVDIFAVRQWPSHKPDLDFSAVVKQCDSFLVVCSPEGLDIEQLRDKQYRLGTIPELPYSIRSRITFFRVWCLVEINAAVVHDKTIVFKLNMSSDKARDLLSLLQVSIDIANADATVPEDKARILNDIEKSGVDVTEMNSTIRGVLNGMPENTAKVLDDLDRAGLSQSERDSAMRAILTGKTILATVQSAALGDGTALQKVCSAPQAHLLSVIKMGNVPLLHHLLGLGVDLTYNGEGASPLMAATIAGKVDTLKLLIKAGCEVNQCDSQGHSAVWHAAQCGQLKCLQALLDAGAKADTLDRAGSTPLMAAVHNGYRNCASVLIDAGANIHLQQPSGANAVKLAIEADHADCLKLLITAGCDVNFKTIHADGEYQTPLMHCVTNDAIKCLKYMLTTDCDLEARTSKGTTALALAALADCVPFFQLLAEEGCNVNSKDAAGISILCAAAREGMNVGMRLLIESGCDVNDGDEHITPLMAATVKANTEGMDLLIAAGCELDAKRSQGYTALMFAATRPDLQDCVDRLIQARCDVNVRDPNGLSVLALAVRAGVTESVKALLKAGCDVNYGNGNLTPLMMACLKGRTECVEALIDAACEIETRDEEQGVTALMYAIGEGHLECAKLLIHAGADITVTDYLGRTPIILAVYTGHQDAMKLLVENGLSPMAVIEAMAAVSD